MPYAFSLRRLLTLSLLTPVGVSGQAPDTVTLKPVVVTASRFPQSPDAVSATVTVLHGDDLRARGIRTVLEGLRATPGATVVQSGPFGSQTSLFVRGGESDHVKVLLDGVPLNQPGGSFNFAHLTTDLVERIEVVRGPASVLYGSDAVTGVVQIFTRPGTRGQQLTAGYRAGDYGSHAVEARVEGGGEQAGYAFGFSRFTTRGQYAFNNRYRNAVFSGRLRVQPDDHTDAALSLRYADNVYHVPTDGSGAVVDHNAFSLENGPAAALEVRRRLSPTLEVGLLVTGALTDGGFDNQRDSAADSTVFRSLDNMRRVGADVRANLTPRAGTTLTAGLALEEERLRSFNVCNYSFGDCSGPPMDVRRRNGAVYGQALADLGRRVSLNIGARLEDNEKFGSFMTYRGGAAVRLGSATRLRASLGTGFKEPTFFENYSTGVTVGNPALKPERSRAFEAGVERRLAGGLVTLAATWFDQRFRDLVDFTFSATPNFNNIVGATADGVELEVRSAPAQGVDLAASYTYLRTGVTEVGFDSTAGAYFAPGATLLRRPGHSGHLAATVRPSRLGRLGLDVIYVGPRADQDFSSFPFRRVTLPSYVRVDMGGETELFGGKGAAPAVTLTARVENLFNGRYEEVKNFPARRRAAFVGGELRSGAR
jgi:vitamin B12 transporter